MSECQSPYWLCDSNRTTGTNEAVTVTMDRVTAPTHKPTDANKCPCTETK